jgi:hypothetical protein
VKCDLPLHGDDLIGYDELEPCIDHALSRASLETLIDKKQRWVVGSTELTCSKWWAPSMRFALRIWSGWPDESTSGESPGALDPAWIYAISVSDVLFRPTFAEHAKWKIRLLLDAGIIPCSPLTDAVPLPEHAKASERLMWSAVRDLLSVERVCRCHPAGSPVMATAAFMARWAGTTPDIARDGLVRLRFRGFLTVIDRAATSRSRGHSGLLYRVLGDA